MWKVASGEVDMSAEEGRQGIYHERSIWCGAGNSMAGEGAGIQGCLCLCEHSHEPYGPECQEAKGPAIPFLHSSMPLKWGSDPPMLHFDLRSQDDRDCCWLLYLKACIPGDPEKRGSIQGYLGVC